MVRPILDAHRWVIPATEKREARVMACGLHLLPCFIEVGCIGGVVRVRVAMRAAHIAWAPFTEEQTRSAGNFLGSGCALSVLNLDAQQEFAIWIEWPRIRASDVLGMR